MVTVRGDLIVLMFIWIAVIPVFIVAAWFFRLRLEGVLALEAMFVSVSSSIYTISKIPKKKDDD